MRMSVEEYERMYEGMGIDQYIKFGGYRSDMVQLYQSCFAELFVLWLGLLSSDVS